MGSRHHSRKKQFQPPIHHQVPHKYTVDERVLCYEPDLKKARVLYDSKVLQVVERTDNRGRITVEYKIHFFGWNSSWDRYVAEDCVLKDTNENRQLQKELKAKADILLQSHLKKKKRKKTLSEILKEATKEKEGQASRPNAHDGNRHGSGKAANSSINDSSSSDYESSDDEEERKLVAHIILTDPVRTILERDYCNILGNNMLVKVPADITVIFVFEEYVKFFGFREFKKILDKWKTTFASGNFPPITGLITPQSLNALTLSTKYPVSKLNMRPLPDPFLEDIAKIYRKVRQAQEIVYGLKTIFDYMLYQMLLYDVENEQYKSYKRMRPKMPVIDCTRMLPRYMAANKAGPNAPATVAGEPKVSRPAQSEVHNEVLVSAPPTTSNAAKLAQQQPSTSNAVFKLPHPAQSQSLNTNAGFKLPPTVQPQFSNTNSGFKLPHPVQPQLSTNAAFKVPTPVQPTNTNTGFKLPTPVQPPNTAGFRVPSSAQPQYPISNAAPKLAHPAPRQPSTSKAAAKLELSSTLQASPLDTQPQQQITNAAVKLPPPTQTLQSIVNDFSALLASEPLQLSNPSATPKLVPTAQPQLSSLDAAPELAPQPKESPINPAPILVAPASLQTSLLDNPPKSAIHAPPNPLPLDIAPKLVVQTPPQPSPLDSAPKLAVQTLLQPSPLDNAPKLVVEAPPQPSPLDTAPELVIVQAPPQPSPLDSAPKLVAQAAPQPSPLDSAPKLVVPVCPQPSPLDRAPVVTVQSPPQPSTSFAVPKLVPQLQPSTEDVVPTLVPPQPSTTTGGAHKLKPPTPPQPSTSKTASKLEPPTPPKLVPQQPSTSKAAPKLVPQQPSTSKAAPKLAPQPSNSMAAPKLAPQPSTSMAAPKLAPQPSTSMAAPKLAPSAPPRPAPNPSTSTGYPNVPNPINFPRLPPHAPKSQIDQYTLWTKKAEQYAKDLSSWRMLPAECYAQEQPDPCMVYGLIHLLRLFVKLPDILNRTLIPRRKVRIIAHHVNMMIEHIQSTYAFPMNRMYVKIPKSTYEEDQIGFGAVASEEDKCPPTKVEKEPDLSQYHTRSYRTETLDRAVPQLPKVVEVPLSSTSDAVEEHKLTVSNYCTEDTVEICVDNPSAEPVEAPKSNEVNTVIVTEPPQQERVPIPVKEIKVEANDQGEELKTTPKDTGINTSQQRKRKAEARATREVSPPFSPMVRKVRKSAADAAFKTAHIFNSIPMAPRVVPVRRDVVKSEPVSNPTAKKRVRSGESSMQEPKRVTRISDNIKEPNSKVLVKDESAESVTQNTQGRNSRQQQRSSITTKKSVSRSPQNRGSGSNTSNPTSGRKREDNSPNMSGSKKSKVKSEENHQDKGQTANNPRKASPSGCSNRGCQSAERKADTPKKLQIVPKTSPSPRTSKSGSISKEAGSPTKTPQKTGVQPSTTLRLRSRSDERQLRSKGHLINALSLPIVASRTSLGSKPKERSPTRRESSGHRDSGPSNVTNAKQGESGLTLRRSKR